MPPKTPTKPDGEPEVDYAALALANEQKVAEQDDRIRKLEDFIVLILPELHTVKINCQLTHQMLSRRSGEWYVKGRDLLGPKGEVVDRNIRGV